MKIVIQIIGIAAMLGSVYSFQLNKHKHIMIAQIIATVLFGAQYYLLGAFTGVALDAVGVVRDIVFYNKDKKWASGNIWTVPKLVRRTILIASPFLLVYNILTGSIGGVINEIFVEISSVVGMLRHDIKKK